MNFPDGGISLAVYNTKYILSSKCIRHDIPRYSLKSNGIAHMKAQENLCYYIYIRQYKQISTLCTKKNKANKGITVNCTFNNSATEMSNKAILHHISILVFPLKWEWCIIIIKDLLQKDNKSCTVHHKLLL